MPIASPAVDRAETRGRYDPSLQAHLLALPTRPRQERDGASAVDGHIEGLRRVALPKQERLL